MSFLPGASPVAGRVVVQRLSALAGNNAVQQAMAVLQRETAQEVIDRHTNLGGLNLQEEELGAYLGQRALASDYAIVAQVIEELPSSDRDDVAAETMKKFSIPAVCTMARNPAAVQMLRLLKNAMTDFPRWRTEEEVRLSELVAAVLDDPGARDSWNRARIEQVKGDASSDLEALAQLFADDQLVDDGTVQSRALEVLSATAHRVVPGLQTGIEFSDSGFAGDRNAGGAGFRDPHASSRNQVGHFLTAVGLQFSPDVVSRQIPGIGLVRLALGVPNGNTIRELIQAPDTLTDEDVALRLTIGHEKAPDPPGGAEAAIAVLLSPAPVVASQAMIRMIVGAFRAQFAACSDADVEAWNRAIAALGTANRLNLDAAEPQLQRIGIVFAYRGNSVQDLRLSLVGWRLGQMLRSNAFGNDRQRVAAWLRSNLGAHR